MKKLLVFALCMTALAACNQKPQEAEKQQNTAERDSLTRIIAQKDNEINDMMSTFNDIEEGFRAISAAEERVSVARQGEGASMKERIQENMQFIKQTMQQNRELINKLRNQLRQSTLNADQLKRTLENLTKEMEEKDAQIKSLIAELEAKDVQIGELSTQVTDLKTEVADHLEAGQAATHGLVCLRHEEGTEGAEHPVGRRGAALELQPGLLHED